MSENSGDPESGDGRRKAREVLNDHLRLRQEGRLDEDLERNYREDVVMLTPSSTYVGIDGIRDCAALLYKAIEDASEYEYHATVCDERMALLEWSATGDDMAITDGVDSYLIEDGRICAQTVRYTVTFKDLSQARAVG